MSVIYHKRIIKINPNKKNTCMACGKSVAKGQITRTNIHHYRYKYSTKKVLKNPALALEDTLELDFPCHKIADALRTLNETRFEDIIKVLKAHPEDIQNKILGIRGYFLSTL